MNKCYFTGKVLNEPIFKFFFMGDNISISYFFILLENNCKIELFALNELADYIYQNIHSNQIVCIDGSLYNKLNNKFSVQINSIEIIT